MNAKKNRLDHIALTVRDYKKSKSFYQKALEPLGYRLLMEFDENVGGFGTEEKPDFWIGQGRPTKSPVHVAFASAQRSSVDAFHAAAIEAGGEDNGAPGLRPHYHPHYYGAFVIDPDGNNIEAVCHQAP
jgi:catechol 2,3-dioxygenase-like lactoylglutathione lyase family enzyme